jgi:hypothetical protein
MQVKKYFALMAGIVALLLMGGSVCRPTHRATPEDQLYAEQGGNAGRVVPDSACGSQKRVQGR